MRKRSVKPPDPVSIKFTAEDRRIIDALAKKKGGNIPSVLREAIRVLAEKEQANNYA